MKENTEMLLDIIYDKKNHLELFIDELKSSLNIMDENNLYIYKSELSKKQESIKFLDSLIQYINNTSNSGITYLKNYLKKAKKENLYSISSKIEKEAIVKSLLKEYNKECAKNYLDNKYIGLTGIFNNELFCSIIRKRINKYSNCNKVTVNKYKHLTAFLGELLQEMENSKNPLKTLKQKIKIYKKYKKTEYIEIRGKQNPKIDIIKEILEDYKKEKAKLIRCK